VEPKEEFPKEKMGFDPQKRFTKSNKTSNVENRVWCELVKLHTVYEKKPTKELVGRERKTAQEKSKEHHPKAALGLGDPLSARKDDLVVSRDEAISVSLVQILLLENEGTQLVAELAVLAFIILFFCARCLTRIYGLRTGAMQELREVQRSQQWWRRRKQGTGKQ
jgi:hypothetical protein